MSETINQEFELEAAKTLADEMGLKYHPSIGLEKLQEKIAEAQTNGVEEEAVEAAPKEKTLAEQKAEMLKLIRIRVTCMNPVKRDWQGEVFSVGNRLIPTQKKFVPFETEWHVPQIILDVMKDKKYQHFYSVKDKFGRSIRKGKLVKEYSIEILPPLTESELKDLAQRQAMANGTAETE